MKYRNRVVLCGILAKEFDCETKYETNNVHEGILDVTRTSGVKDSMILRVCENQFRDGIIPFDKGDRIWVLGELRTYSYIENGVRRNRNYVNVLDIAEVYEKTPQMNSVELVGFIRKKGDFRYTLFGRKIQELIIEAKTKSGKNAYIPIILWGDTAYYASLCYNEGDEIKVKGRYQSRNYTKVNSNGEIEEKTTYEVSVEKIES